MKIDNLEELLSQEMEEVRGGVGEVCECAQMGAASSSEGGKCICQSGAAAPSKPEVEKPDKPEPINPCMCTTGAKTGG